MHVHKPMLVLISIFLDWYISTLLVYKDTSPSKVTLLPPSQSFLVLILTLGFMLQEMGSDVAVYRNQA